MGLKPKAPIKEAIKAPVKKGLSVPKTGPKEELKVKASENTTVVKKKGKEPEVVIKQSANKDHAPKHNMPKGEPSYNPRTAGISFGSTINMGDYESLRVDCWLTDEVGEDETQQQALTRLGDVVQQQVEYEVSRVKGN